MLFFLFKACCSATKRQTKCRFKYILIKDCNIAVKLHVFKKKKVFCLLKPDNINVCSSCMCVVFLLSYLEFVTSFLFKMMTLLLALLLTHQSFQKREVKLTFFLWFYLDLHPPPVHSVLLVNRTVLINTVSIRGRLKIYNQLLYLTGLNHTCIYSK